MWWSGVVKATQLCLTLCNPMGYTVHGILQARILERVAFPFSRGSSQPRSLALQADSSPAQPHLEVLVNKILPIGLLRVTSNQWLIGTGVQMPWLPQSLGGRTLGSRFCSIQSIPMIQSSKCLLSNILIVFPLTCLSSYFPSVFPGITTKHTS